MLITIPPSPFPGSSGQSSMKLHDYVVVLFKRSVDHTFGLDSIRLAMFSVWMYQVLNDDSQLSFQLHPFDLLMILHIDEWLPMLWNELHSHSLVCEYFVPQDCTGTFSCDVCHRKTKLSSHAILFDQDRRKRFSTRVAFWSGDTECGTQRKWRVTHQSDWVRYLCTLVRDRCVSRESALRDENRYSWRALRIVLSYSSRWVSDSENTGLDRFPQKYLDEQTSYQNPGGRKSGWSETMAIERWWKDRLAWWVCPNVHWFRAFRPKISRIWAGKRERSRWRTTVVGYVDPKWRRLQQTQRKTQNQRWMLWFREAGNLRKRVGVDWVMVSEPDVHCLSLARNTE
jgi:hypothetical protein